MSFQTTNPYHNQLVESFSEHTDEQVKEVLSVAEKAFKNWKATTFTQRSALMRKCGQLLLANHREYAEIITLEMGKPITEAIGEVKKCATACEFYAENAERFLQDEVVETDASKSVIAYQPLGAVLAIMPWNFPFWQVFRFACPTLMAGNVGLLKHASNVPQCAMAIESVFREAGFPEGVFSTLLIGSDKVESIIEADIVQAITLTGSEGAGSKVAAIAGKNIKRTVLELGGSDAFVVLPDADLDYTARMAVKARMVNTGQSCICAKRFIVIQSVAEEFTNLFKKYLLELKGGNPMEEDTDYGPMAREDLANELLEQVEKSVALGAKVVVGGSRPDQEGAFFNPTILTHVKPGMPAYDEEMFGPVAAILVANDEAHAIQLANDSRYGLGASVWTRNVEAGEKIARQIESGAVFINEVVQSDPRMPFGGVKKSGYGRELSYLGIREFVNIRTIWVK